MNLPFFIARRYLFSKKKRNVINIISYISVAGVSIGTCALVVVLSVFNGIDGLLQEMVGSMNPDVTILPREGKFTTFSADVISTLDGDDRIANYSVYLEDKAMLKYDNTLKPVVVKGVSGDYGEKTGMVGQVVKGDFSLGKTGQYKAVLGYNIAAEMGIGLKLLTPMVFYYPDRNAQNALKALHSEYLYPSGFLLSQQETDKLVLTDTAFASSLFMRRGEYSGIEIRLSDKGEMIRVKEELLGKYGQDYRIEDKYELNKSFYAMLESEKLAIFMILLFIFLIASFNIVGSITMLIIDKQEDIKIYRALGMTDKKLISVFGTEGNLITLSGCIVGMVIGVILCWLQERFGFIKLGNGGYIVSAYPVELVWKDILCIITAVMLIGCTASYFPVRYLIKRRVNSN